MANSKRDISCSQNSWCLCLVSFLAMVLLGLYSVPLSVFFFWIYSYTLNFSVEQLILFHHRILIIFLCVNASYFPKVSSAACEIKFLTFLHSTTIMLLSEILYGFSLILSMYSHCIRSSLSNLILFLKKSIFSLHAVFSAECNQYHFLCELSLLETVGLRYPGYMVAIQQSGFDCRQGQNIFLFTASRKALEPIQQASGSFCPAMKWLGSRAHYTFVSSVEVIKCMALNLHSPVRTLATLLN